MDREEILRKFEEVDIKLAESRGMTLEEYKRIKKIELEEFRESIREFQKQFNDYETWSLFEGELKKHKYAFDAWIHIVTHLRVADDEALGDEVVKLMKESSREKPILVNGGFYWCERKG